jgi:3-hydroxyacyl-[acyl-carrier-protein] dehydratase
MSLAEIHAAIPHRPPFLMIDEIVERDERRIVCRKTFHADDYFYAGHYPNYPLTPGVLLCEAAMQSGAVLLAKYVPPMVEDLAGSVAPAAESDSPSGGRRVPVAARMNDVRFKRMVKPGETIDIEVVLNEQLAGVFFLSAKVTCNGLLAARLDFVCTLAPVV